MRRLLQSSLHLATAPPRYVARGVLSFLKRSAAWALSPVAYLAAGAAGAAEMAEHQAETVAIGALKLLGACLAFVCVLFGSCALYVLLYRAVVPPLHIQRFVGPPV